MLLPSYLHPNVVITISKLGLRYKGKVHFKLLINHSGKDTKFHMAQYISAIADTFLLQ